MKTLGAILFWLVAGFGFGYFTCARRLFERLRMEEPDTPEDETLSRALRARPGDFDDPDTVRLATWMWRFAAGFVIAFFLFISQAFWRT